MVGCETAELICEEAKGRKKIIIVEMLSELASDVDPIAREFLIQRLKDKGVQAILNMKVEEITAEGVVTIDKDWKKHLIKGDLVILAMGAEPELNLAKSLEKKKIRFHAIGDCNDPRRIIDAIHEAAHIARQI